MVLKKFAFEIDCEYFWYYSCKTWNTLSHKGYHGDTCRNSFHYFMKFIIRNRKIKLFYKPFKNFLSIHPQLAVQPNKFVSASISLGRGSFFYVVCHSYSKCNICGVRNRDCKPFSMPIKIVCGSQIILGEFFWSDNCRQPKKINHRCDWIQNEGWNSTYLSHCSKENFNQLIFNTFFKVEKSKKNLNQYFCNYWSPQIF